jgi:gluconolactonase
LAKPFHIYDEEFYDVIGSSPSLTQIASSESDPIFHEAVTWYAHPYVAYTNGQADKPKASQA